VLRWIFFDLGLDHALGGKPSPSTDERWFMVYNAGQAFEPLNKRTDMGKVLKETQSVVLENATFCTRSR
jgi:hypothetical protein